MTQTKKLRFLRARGNPMTNAVIGSGACLDMPEPWASRFLEDGTAILAEPVEKAAKPSEPQGLRGGSKKKGK